MRTLFSKSKIIQADGLGGSIAENTIRRRTSSIRVCKTRMKAADDALSGFRNIFIADRLALDLAVSTRPLH